MTQPITITADVNASESTLPVGLEVWLNNDLIHNINPGVEVIKLSVYIDDSIDAEHELKFVLKGKTDAHTQVDDQGNIVKDVLVNISNIMFDGIELGSMVPLVTTYTHNSNSNGPETVDKFYGTIGCNGTVSLKFTTPIYLWLLENL